MTTARLLDQTGTSELAPGQGRATLDPPKPGER
jgi:hypothetical protein